MVDAFCPSGYTRCDVSTYRGTPLNPSHLSAAPDLCVILVSYRSKRDLERCLPTLVHQPLRLEILVVDNHGGDGVREWLESTYPKITLISAGRNLGYAGGCNLGLRHAAAPWVLFLNPDTEWPAEALSRFLAAARTHPDALWTPKLLHPDGAINACGNEMHFTGITTCRALGEPASAKPGIKSVPLLSGAAILGRRDVLRDLGGFDESYFMYFEDTDLSLRARLSGYRLLCHGDIMVTHHYRLAMNPAKLYYLERNRLRTLAKVLTGASLIRLLPALAVTELAAWAYALRGPAYVWARMRAYAWIMSHLRAVREVRRMVQAERQTTDADLWKGSLDRLPFHQVSSSWIQHWLERLTVWLYRRLRPAVFRDAALTAVANERPPFAERAGRQSRKSA